VQAVYFRTFSFSKTIRHVADLSGVWAIALKIPVRQFLASEAVFLKKFPQSDDSKPQKNPELERLSCHLEGKDYGRLWSGMRVLSGG